MQLFLTRLCIGVIVVYSLFLRFYHFPVYPDLHVDEMSFGYSAYAWWHGGLDEYGRPPGILLQSLGDWKLALYSYFVFPLVALFGLNAWSVRLPSALFSLVTIPLFWLVTQRLWRDKLLSWISALTMALLPWSVIFARTANEVTMELFFLLGSVYFFLTWREKQKRLYLYASTALGALALISYYPAFMTVPLIMGLVALLWSEGTWRERRWQLGWLPLAGVGLVLSAFLLTQPKDRIGQTSFLSSKLVPALMQERRDEATLGGVPVLISKVLYNRETIVLWEFAEKFAAHFDPRFLFLSGEVSYSRYSIPYQGPLFVWMLPFLLIGMWRIGNGKEWRLLLLTLGWIVAAIAPDSLTYDGANIQRSFLVLPPLIWLNTLGLEQTVVWLQQSRRWIRFSGYGLVGSLVVASCGLLSINYFVHMKYHMPWQRNGYVQELLTKLRAHEKDFTAVKVSHLPYLQMFYFDRTDPAIAREILKNHANMSQGYQSVDRYLQFESIYEDCPHEGEKNVLYACLGYTVPQQALVVDTVRYADAVPVYTFVTFTRPDDPRIYADKGYRIVVQ